MTEHGRSRRFPREEGRMCATKANESERIMTPKADARPGRAWARLNGLVLRDSGRWRMALWAVLACLVAGCAANPPSKDLTLSAGAGPAEAQSPITLVGSGGGYAIEPGDRLSIQFPYRPDYSSTLVVRPDGHISMMLLGSVTAAGKTPEQLQSELSSRYLHLEGGNSVPTVKATEKKHYYINAGDLLEIKFAYHPDLNDKVVVRPDGRISLVMVKSFVAEGQTPEALGRELQSAYRHYIKDPDLVVIVRRFSSDRYYVDGHLVRAGIMDLDKVVVNVIDAAPMQIYVGGEVRKAGYLPYRGNMTAMQAIISAGGATTSADMSQVAVIRKLPNQKGKLMVRNLTFSKVDAGDEQNPGPLARAAESDVSLRPYDVVIVPKSGIASFNAYLQEYLYQVFRPVANSSFTYIYGQTYIK